MLFNLFRKPHSTTELVSLIISLKKNEKKKGIYHLLFTTPPLVIPKLFRCNIQLSVKVITSALIT